VSTQINYHVWVAAVSSELVADEILQDSIRAAIVHAVERCLEEAHYSEIPTIGVRGPEVVSLF